MASSFQLYLYTVNEYTRFVNYLPVKHPDKFTDNYTEADYVGIQVRLMLLRKYFHNDERERVSLKNLLNEAKSKFPHRLNDFQMISDQFEKVGSQQIEHLLSDGTNLNVYNTIEDTIYGLYLHADEEKIKNIENTTESIRFICIRKYILDVESIIFELYDLLIKCGVISEIESVPDRAPVLMLGDTSQNTQSVTGSPFWSNLYGYDATTADVKKIEQEISDEDKDLISFCVAFTNELKKSNMQLKKLRNFVHPATLNDWGDFKEAQLYFCSIPNPGFSSKICYNEARDIAYVKVFPNVKKTFVIDTPHALMDCYEFTLVNWCGNWKIYRLGHGHMESVYKKKNEG